MAYIEIYILLETSKIQTDFGTGSRSSLSTGVLVFAPVIEIYHILGIVDHLLWDQGHPTPLVFQGK